MVGIAWVSVRWIVLTWIENGPFADGEVILRVVIQGSWYRLVFVFDNARFRGGKVALPVIKVEDGEPVFVFAVVADNPVV